MASLLLAIQIATITGCSRSVKWLDQKDRSDVFVQRALVRKDEGDIDSAIKLYAEALDDNQKLARAHLDIALLLHHQKGDYIRAIYHYERYLELCPQTEKRDMIENRIRIAKQSFVASVVPRNLKDVPDARVTDDHVAPAVQGATWSGKPDQRGVQQMTEERKKSEEVEALKKENAVLKSKISQLSSELNQIRAAAHVRNSEQQTIHLGRGFGAQTDNGQRITVAHDEQSKPTAYETKRVMQSFETDMAGAGDSRQKVIRTYRVERGDTLASIAAEICNDASMWKKIYEANRDKLRSPDDIKVGQILVIP